MTHELKIDYMTVGHVCYDLTPHGLVTGGTAAYSSRVAHLLGCRTAVLTSTSADYDLRPVLPGLEICTIDAESSTTFENVYTEQGRHQTLHARARTLTWDHVPNAWKRAAIVHFGPIANEIDVDMIPRFSNSLIGLTPQGWFRTWDDQGRIHPVDWPAAASVLPLAAAVILSLEDIPDLETLAMIKRHARLVVLTRQDQGCTVFFDKEMREIPAPNAKEVNPTGAGDVFAAAFLIRLHQTKGNPWESAIYANRIAATSVSHDDLPDKLAAIAQMNKMISQELFS